MKILCVADHIDPLVYSASVKQRYGSANLVLGAGDLPMEYLGFISSMLNKPVLFVFGNHNLKNRHLFRSSLRGTSSEPEIDCQIRNYFGSVLVSDRVVRVETLLIAGLGGSMRYNNGENQYTDRQMYFRIFRLIPRLVWNRIVHGRYLDILLTHAPPRGIHDKPDRCHLGFDSFLWFMRAFRPRFLLHGHIHLYDLNAERRTRYHETTVVNVYDHYLLDTDAPV